MSAILTLNAGSSSIKYSVYVKEAAEPREIAVGQIDGLGPDAKLVLKHNGDKTVSEIGEADQTTGLKAILAALKPILGDQSVTGVGHRIVHGGPDYADPMVLDESVLTELEKLNQLAPLHQPHNIAAVRAAMEAFPGAVQVGCFDTGFHQGHDFANDAYALPLELYEKGIRRYGFHGLSYDYITGYIQERYPELNDAKIVIAHLGNGASMTAVQGRHAVASTLGFSALDGLPMGTRCGQLDPGVLLYLLDKGMSTAELTNMLYKESGMKGLSGMTHDMRAIKESDDPRAKRALEYYIARVTRELGALAAASAGIDAVVFTGGVGEHSPAIRKGVAENLGFLGVSLDDEANERNAESIGNGAVKAMVIPTDEEVVIARAVASKLH